MKTSSLSFCLALAVMVPAQALPATRASVTDYAITISGLPLAKASFKTSIDGRDFRIAGNFSTVGLVNAFKKWSGSAAANGKVSNSGFQPDSYRTTYKIGKAERGFEVAFSNGNITKFSRTPERDAFPAEWVAVSKSDLRAIADPMTALILPASGGSVCRGTVPVFDGETRMELNLSPKGETTYRKGKVAEKVQVCRVDFKVKSGYHKGHSDLEKVQQSKGFEVWLAKSPIADVYAPVYVKIPTQFGTLAISATRFGS
ncbi:DUF3108 domain-containing protein [Rhizobium sp. L1K21]|uniref:DUF3108 domain-containing protein n=1 Tax=Rhizobium sp. L1K21 TaxID=2954933 RepID=UPI002092ECAD|nr:DUF3108 domain-containing protein [Rhizobium sp. L1K21]MCO6188157.1 DUF3108 domain-containing protein [Rhizobium sp. L1K21]